jgi:hypothetical protein
MLYVPFKKRDALVFASFAPVFKSFYFNEKTASCAGNMFIPREKALSRNYCMEVSGAKALVIR